MSSLLASVFGAVDNTVSDMMNPAKWLIDWSLGRRTQAGEHISENTALGLSGYWACLRSISEDIGKLPLITYRRVKRGKERATEHWAYKLLHDRPNPIQSSFTFRELMTQRALGWGGGFAEIQRDLKNRPVALWPIHPSRVRAKWFESKEVRYEVRMNDARGLIELRAENVLHIRGLGDELNGWSVAKMGAESLGLTMAAQTFGASFFGNGSSPAGAISYPDELEPEAQDKLRRDWVDMYSGPENAFKPVILEYGAKWEKIGIPPNEAQFLEMRQFQIEELCRWFRMPPHKIQHLLRATFSNIEEQSIEYVVDTLTPWMVRWEQEIKIKLLGEPADENVFAEHLILGLLRGDQSKRAEFFVKLFNIGALSQNDIREIENLNTIGDYGDTYYVPLNMIRSELAATAPLPGSQPKPGAPPEKKTNDETPPGELDDPLPETEQNDDEETDGPSPRRRPLPERGDGSSSVAVPEDMADEVVAGAEDGIAHVQKVLSPILESVSQQLTRKEEKAAERAMKKFAGDNNGEQFVGWLDEFYSGHVLHVRQALAPIMAAGAALLGDTKTRDCEQLAFLHCERSKPLLRTIFFVGNRDKDKAVLPGFAARRAKELSYEALREILR